MKYRKIRASQGSNVMGWEELDDGMGWRECRWVNGKSFLPMLHTW